MKQKKCIKWLKIGFIMMGVILLIGIIGISVVTGKQVAEGLMYYNRGNDTKQNSIKQLETWGFGLEDFQKEYVGEDFTLESSDKVKVPVTYFQANQSRNTPVVILVHGAGGDRVSVVPLAKLYLERGWNVLTFDQRASGDNSGDKVSFGYFEARDVECVVDYAVNILKSEKVVVHGQSMGASTVGLYATTNHAKENVQAVIMDSPVDSMEHMFRGVFSQMEGSEDIPTDYVVACGDIYLKLFYGMSFADANTMERMKDNQVKTLVILSEKDTVCLPEDIMKLYNNIKAADKKLVRVDSEHIEGAIDNPEGYINQVLEFIEE